MSNKEKGSLEQIYTPKKLSKFLCDLVKKNYKEPISEIVEICAGDGSMLDVINEEFYFDDVIGYDIDPHRDDIIKMDLMKHNLEYKKGRVIITNFPFSKGLKMLYKCLAISDMVVCICSLTSIVSLDYDKYDVVDLYGIKKQGFKDGNKYSISIMCVKNKV